MEDKRFLIASDLNSLERDLSVTFPDSFRAMVQDSKSPSRKILSDSFPQYICPQTAADVRSLQDLTGTDMIPFLVTDSLSDGDIYCFHIIDGKINPQVSAISDQAVVATWPSFEIFIQWAAELLEPTETEPLYFVD